MVTLVDSLKPEDGTRGIVCLQDLPPDYEFLRLPSSLILNPTTSKHFQAHLKPFLKKIRVSDWTPLMWSMILERRDRSSFWKPYLDSIPHKINLPCEWPSEDQEYLKGTKIYAQLQTDFSVQDREFERVSKKAGLSIPNLREEYHAAGSVISAYSFCDDKMVSMVPFADLLNHKTGCNNARLFFEDDQLSMRCIRACAKGEQLYNTYGDLGNTELLLKYGYICPGNRLTDVTIDLENLPNIQRLLDTQELERVLEAFPDGEVPINSKSFRMIGANLFERLVQLELRRHKPKKAPQNPNQEMAAAYLRDYRKALQRKACRSLDRC